MRNSTIFLFLLQALLAFSAIPPSLLTRQTTCGAFEIKCGKVCCGELAQTCADASKSLCCDEGQVEIDGICCAQGGTVTNGVCCTPSESYLNGICCPKGQNNCGGTCCPGLCWNPISIPRVPLTKRNTPFCIATQAGCKTIQNASGTTCSQASQCGDGSWVCDSGCCINVPIIH